MIERRIKELSIAFEALSRINDIDAVECLQNVSELLKQAIEEAKGYNTNVAPTPQSHNDDNIPF